MMCQRTRRTVWSKINIITKAVYAVLHNENWCFPSGKTFSKWIESKKEEEKKARNGFSECVRVCRVVDIITVIAYKFIYAMRSWIYVYGTYADTLTFYHFFFLCFEGGLVSCSFKMALRWTLLICWENFSVGTKIVNEINMWCLILQVIHDQIAKRRSIRSLWTKGLASGAFFYYVKTSS